MNRFVAIAVVVLAMPLVVGLARASFGPPERTVATSTLKELSAIAVAEALPRKYGLEVVAMPEPPNADGRQPNADDRLPTGDGRFPMADSRLPLADGRPPIADSRPPTADPAALVCPDIRAIVSGASPFAIVAWNDASLVVKPAQTLTAPAGEVTVRRISAKSITFAKADTTLQCKLSVR
jgi:hypothetical protein